MEVFERAKVEVIVVVVSVEADVIVVVYAVEMIALAIIVDDRWITYVYLMTHCDRYMTNYTSHANGIELFYFKISRII